VRGGKKIDKKNLVLITFDDGHADNYQAYRVLNKLGMSAVFFIPSDKIGDQGRLSASEVVKMHNDGMDIGSHTKSEVYCPDLEGEDFKVELLDSKLVLEHLIGGKVKSIAYPMGGYNRATMQAVKEAGYKIAFTTNRGFDKHWRNDNPYQLRRIKVTFRDNDFKLWAKLTGFYNWLRSVKDPY
jgi:peptidoglycan/xylan/chitin deacetylase (PgdA/CDA1 family)